MPPQNNQGRLAEGLGNGLQNRLKQFDSATDLRQAVIIPMAAFFMLLFYGKFLGGCFVVASSFPVPSEYLAGTLRVQTYYQGTPKVPKETRYYCVNSAKRIYLLEIKIVREITSFLGNELATVSIAVVCIALPVWVTLTDANIVKYNRQKEK